MTTYFISRHPGALKWMQRKQIPFDRHIAHLDVESIRPGDVVIGSLPGPSRRMSVRTERFIGICHCNWQPTTGDASFPPWN
jgi:putative CRISPR-associated protein (TIGR02620 family)